MANAGGSLGSPVSPEDGDAGAREPFQVFDKLFVFLFEYKMFLCPGCDVVARMILFNYHVRIDF